MLLVNDLRYRIDRRIGKAYINQHKSSPIEISDVAFSSRLAWEGMMEGHKNRKRVIHPVAVIDALLGFEDVDY